MKKVTILGSLVAVFLIAFFVSRTNDSVSSRDAEGVGSSSEKIRSGRSGRSEKAENPGGYFRSLSGEEYQAAWDAIPAMGLGKKARLALQREILAEWGRRDLKAAAKAALSEAWDETGGVGSSTLESQLAAAFGDVFLRRPDEVFEMIKGDEFGILESAIMRTAWVQGLMRRDPKMLLPYLSKLDPSNQRAAVERLARIAGKEALEDLWSSLRGQEVLGSSVGRLLTDRTSVEYSREEVLALIGEGGSTLQLAVTALAKQISTQPLTAAALEIAGELPEEARGDFVHALMKEESNDPEFARQGIEQLMEMDAWDALSEKAVSEKVRLIAAETPPKELAAWAVSLPQRKEAALLFHRGVEPYIQSDPDLAWDWIGEFEEGMWRDRAYAEFSQQALNHFSDPVRSEEALNQISDPAFQKEAWSWRRGWENRNGFKR